MAVWDELKVVLVRLRDQEPGTLLGGPMPEVDEGREPPFSIHLAARAVGVAEELHRRFGDSVDLTVGALPYPPPGRPPHHSLAQAQSADLLDPCEMEAELDGPAVVRSGDTLWHGLVLRNLTGQDFRVETNGQITAEVVDPETGETVGGFAGAQVLPLIVFRVDAGQTQRIPLLIGTASFTPRLGYAVPAGHWGVQATLVLRSGSGGPPSKRRTPVLPLTITA